MKKWFLLILFVLALSVVGTLGAEQKVEQKFSSLPIGYNLEEYIHLIQVRIWTNGKTTEEDFPYNGRHDGSLESFAVQKLREFTSRYVPPQGKETAPHAWSVNAITEGVGGLLPTYNGESNPATIAVAPPAGESSWFYPILRNGRWEVPEEVFGKVKFQFGWGVGYYIPGVTDLEVNLYNGTRVSRFSTRERISDADNPCELPAIMLALPDVVIPNEIALARPAWWEYAEITLYTPTQSVMFLVNRTAGDGKAIRWSNPPPAFFIPPLPTIASLKRVGTITEMTVEGSGTVALEFSENLRDWQEVALSRPVLASERTSIILHHGSTAAQGFYRLRHVRGQ